MSQPCGLFEWKLNLELNPWFFKASLGGRSWLGCSICFYWVNVFWWELELSQVASEDSSSQDISGMERVPFPELLEYPDQLSAPAEGWPALCMWIHSWNPLPVGKAHSSLLRFILYPELWTVSFCKLLFFGTTDLKITSVYGLSLTSGVAWAFFVELFQVKCSFPPPLFCAAFSLQVLPTLLFLWLYLKISGYPPLFFVGI